jgi:hypothetical protein
MTCTAPPATSVEGVVEVVARRRGAGVVRHAPPSVVGLEGLHERKLLDLVVALGHHPRPRTRQRLDEAAVRVPPRLDVVSVREVAGEEEHVVVGGRDVLQRGRRPSGLAKVACHIINNVHHQDHNDVPTTWRHYICKKLLQ